VCPVAKSCITEKSPTKEVSSTSSSSTTTVNIFGRREAVELQTLHQWHDILAASRKQAQSTWIECSWLGHWIPSFHYCCPWLTYPITVESPCKTLPTQLQEHCSSCCCICVVMCCWWHANWKMLEERVVCYAAIVQPLNAAASSSNTLLSIWEETWTLFKLEVRTSSSNSVPRDAPSWGLPLIESSSNRGQWVSRVVKLSLSTNKIVCIFGQFTVILLKGLFSKSIFFRVEDVTWLRWTRAKRYARLEIKLVHVGYQLHPILHYPELTSSEYANCAKNWLNFVQKLHYSLVA